MNLEDYSISDIQKIKIIQRNLRYRLNDVKRINDRMNKLYNIMYGIMKRIHNNFILGIIFFVSLHPRISISFLSKTSLIFGRKSFEIFEETTNDSSVLHVPSLCVFELSTTFTAIARLANSSTYI